MHNLANLKPLLAMADQVSIYLSRVAMGLVVVLVGAMLYEVVSRRIFNSPTIWAFD